MTPEYYKTRFSCSQVWVQQGILFNQVAVHHTILGVVKWQSIYIRKCSNIAAPLITSLQGKYERVPGVDGRKGRCRVPRERNSIQWTPETESAFVHLREALSAESELHTPSPDGDYCIQVD